MADYAFQLVNVFTRDFDGGNPLAVFTDATGLTDAQMQAVARQMNLSETVFLFPSETADASLRIFTPATELPFAGHPTLGSAYVVAQLKGLGDAVRLETHAGVIPVAIGGHRFTLTANAPTQRPAGFNRAEAAATFKLAEHDVAADPVWVNTGVEQLLIRLSSREAVLTAQPDLPLFFTYCGEDPAHQLAYLWHEEFGEATVRLFFADNGGLREDPGTGSAAANLGGWCVLNGAELPLSWRLLQGETIHRLNLLHLDVSAEGAIRVGGDVVFVGQGSLVLPD
ncbi:PhzF family phenazine biosynthesis protein [Crenobacter cavernae]|uniref:PhzF family phenazine biosynthesis protein n=1 Tax=Crenobacter cavernae TaxID=2290923 RepID=A0ABY0FF22_9NEIS|nr:PhzF family phenazine biosynthesis protein [Crenobacter cavernae]RXZ44840.1 PhzF family phenazine biosynthesis protein [Crenobacter cavernae]